jgi:hypothetical protein
MATAEGWASSMEDVKSRHLKAYGRVHPDLGRELDPRVDEIVAMLRQAADLADRLPDRWPVSRTAPTAWSATRSCTR